MLSKNLSAVSAVAFAATPQDPEDTLQDLNDLLSDDQPIYINSDGTVVVTSVSQHPSSLTELRNVSRISTDAKRFAAVPWYESDSNLVYRGSDLHITGKQLWETEKKVILRQFPQAKTGIMKTTGELYWIVPVDINIGSTTKRWTFMLKYDNNHPHADDWGGSVKVTPIIPSIDDLESRAKAAGRISSGKYIKCEHIPHIWRNYNDHTLYLDTANKRTQAELLSKHTIQSATSAMLSAVHWAYFYEVGLLDSKVWDEFCGFGNIPERCFSPSTADYPMELDRWLEANEKSENGE